MTLGEELEMWALSDEEAIDRMDIEYNNLCQSSTTKERRKYFDFMKYLYDNYESVHRLWDYIEDNFKLVTRFVKKVIKKVRKPRASKYDSVINDNGFDIRSNDGELCYLFEFYNDNDELLCSKVGTTTRTIRQRLIEELRSKTYKGMGATKAVVNRVYNCGEYPAEGLESLIRSEYIKKYPKSFKKNDRFIGELFDFDLCDKIAEGYLGA